MNDKKLEPGVYRHYKGGLYEVIGVGHAENNLEEVVFYRSMQDKDGYKTGSLWTRPLAVFKEYVTVDGIEKPRFTYLGHRQLGRIMWLLYSTTHFELIVWLFCAVMALGLLVLVRDLDVPGLWFNRHPHVDWILALILAANLFLVGYARHVGPWRLVTKNFPLPTPGVKKPLRVALVADIQVGDHKRADWVKKIVARLHQLQPDLILIAGDLVSNELNPEDESVYLEPLALLPALCPTYAVMGNHDFGIGYMQGGSIARTQDKSDFVRARFKKIHVPLLENELVPLNIKGQDIVVFGGADIWGSKQDFAPLKNWDQKTPLIFLTHNPDALLEWPRNIPRPNITLAGHTHAGQINLPFIGPMASAETILPKKHYYGYNTYFGSPMFVTAGVGESLGPLRFGCPPEIAILHLEEKK